MLSVNLVSLLLQSDFLLFSILMGLFVIIAIAAVSSVNSKYGSY